MSKRTSRDPAPGLQGWYFERSACAAVRTPLIEAQVYDERSIRPPIELDCDDRRSSGMRNVV